MIGLIENVHRDDLTDIEKSDALHELRRMTGLEWPEVAQRLRMSAGTVRNLAMLQRLAHPVKEQVRSGELPGYRARALLSLDPPEQVELGRRAVVEHLSEGALRAEVNRIKPGRRSSKATPAPSVGQEPSATENHSDELSSGSSGGIHAAEEEATGAAEVPGLEGAGKSDDLPWLPRPMGELLASLAAAEEWLRQWGPLESDEGRRQLRDQWARIDELLDARTR